MIESLSVNRIFSTYSVHKDSILSGSLLAFKVGDSIHLDPLIYFIQSKLLGDNCDDILSHIENRNKIIKEALENNGANLSETRNIFPSSARSIQDSFEKTSDHESLKEKAEELAEKFEQLLKEKKDLDIFSNNFWLIIKEIYEAQCDFFGGKSEKIKPGDFRQMEGSRGQIYFIILLVESIKFIHKKNNPMSQEMRKFQNKIQGIIKVEGSNFKSIEKFQTKIKEDDFQDMLTNCRDFFDKSLKESNELESFLKQSICPAVECLWIVGNSFKQREVWSYPNMGLMAMILKAGEDFAVIPSVENILTSKKHVKRLSRPAKLSTIYILLYFIFLIIDQWFKLFGAKMNFIFFLTSGPAFYQLIRGSNYDFTDFAHDSSPSNSPEISPININILLGLEERKSSPFKSKMSAIIGVLFYFSFLVLCSFNVLEKDKTSIINKVFAALLGARICYFIFDKYNPCRQVQQYDLDPNGFRLSVEHTSVNTPHLNKRHLGGAQSPPPSPVILQRRVSGGFTN